MGIVGLGRIGTFHLRIYKQIKEVGEIHLADIDKGKTSSFSEPFFSSYKDLLGKVDLVSIASPTSTHATIGKFFLKNKIPCLIEKPLANNERDARSLIKYAQRNKTLLFVGHVERYNNAYLTAKKVIINPQFIECHRLSPYPNRSLDIGVVLDLMIHDLDIILDIVKDKVKRVEAVGIKVLSSSEDIANARITFRGGCVANITASRVSTERVRKFRVFFLNHYISLDYAQQEVDIYKKVGSSITKDVLTIDREEPLRKEIEEFVSMVKNNNYTLDYAYKAHDALALALHIQRLIHKR